MILNEWNKLVYCDSRITNSFITSPTGGAPNAPFQSNISNQLQNTQFNVIPLQLNKN